MGVVKCFGYLVSVLLLLSSSGVFIYLIVSYEDHIKALFYKEANCTIHGAIYVIQLKCDCAESCRSSYPCLLVYGYVNASDIPAEQRLWPVPIYDTDWNQVKTNLEEENGGERCSVRICERNRNTNRDQVEGYKKEYGDPGTVLPCYYGTADLKRKGAVFEQKIPWSLAFHVFFWPGVIFFVGLCICIHFSVYKRFKRESYQMGTNIKDSRESLPVPSDWERY